MCKDCNWQEKDRDPDPIKKERDKTFSSFQEAFEYINRQEAAKILMKSLADK